MVFDLVVTASLRGGDDHWHVELQLKKHSLSNEVQAVIERKEY